MEAIMKGFQSALCAAVSLMWVLILATAAFGADNFTGTWKLNLPMSQYNPGPPPRSLTSKVEVMGETINFTFDGYDSKSASIFPAELSIKLDGKDYPIADDPTRDTIAMKKIDDYTVEETNK